MKAEEQLPQYLAAHIRRAFAEDPRTSELGVRVTIRGSKIYLSGEVNSLARKRELESVVTELAPDITVCNDIHVVSSAEPQSDYEDLQ
ncbi:BON domain-containing protein [Rhodococcus sp. WS3]|uniref:BON domain-containing protein n=1 Tax=Rhodococcus sp. WS3 TaxID=2486271 RepID=UPI0011432E55|nr:BON domain-containing protein [Rhodococcus sp. WS3]ROZ43419.1 BON domain-containing protein [Rhodococcus sp. WS3]